MAEFRGLSVKVPIKFSEKAQKELYETCVAYKELAEVRGVENDKLRKLVRNLYACEEYAECSYCPYREEPCDFEYDMRELGFEVS